MVQRPGSLPAFEARFPDDAACARWLFEKRWPDGFRCPGCGHAKGWEPGRGTLLVECARCHRQTSVTVLSAFAPASIACAELKPMRGQAASKIPSTATVLRRRSSL